MTTDWVPGDPNPLIPDNGCGSLPQIVMTADERAQVLAEDTYPPPWWRPETEPLPVGTGAWTRVCKPCGVGWRGEQPCWMCGKDKA